MAAPILGDLLYRAVSLWTRLAGNTSTTRKFLRQTGTGAASTAPAWDDVKDSDIVFTDITTGNVSITKHGYAPKAPNVATQYLDGTGAYSIPAGAGSVSQVNDDNIYTANTPDPIVGVGTVSVTELSKSAIDSSLHSLLGGI